MESGSSAIEVDLHTYILHGKFVGCNPKCTGSIIRAAAVPVFRLGRVAPAPDFHSNNAGNRIPRFSNPSSSSPRTSFYLTVSVCTLRFSRHVQSVISHLAMSRRSVLLYRSEAILLYLQFCGFCSSLIVLQFGVPWTPNTIVEMITNALRSPGTLAIL